MGHIFDTPALRQQEGKGSTHCKITQWLGSSWINATFLYCQIWSFLQRKVNLTKTFCLSPVSNSTLCPGLSLDLQIELSKVQNLELLPCETHNCDSHGIKIRGISCLSKCTPSWVTQHTDPQHVGQLLTWHKCANAEVWAWKLSFN